MTHQTKPKPSSLAQQIKQAQREWAKLPKEVRGSVRLEGNPEPQRTEPYYGQGTGCDRY